MRVATLAIALALAAGSLTALAQEASPETSLTARLAPALLASPDDHLVATRSAGPGEPLVFAVVTSARGQAHLHVLRELDSTDGVEYALVDAHPEIPGMQSFDLPLSGMPPGDLTGLTAEATADGRWRVDIQVRAASGESLRPLVVSPEADGTWSLQENLPESPRSGDGHAAHARELE